MLGRSALDMGNARWIVSCNACITGSASVARRTASRQRFSCSAPRVPVNTWRIDWAARSSACSSSSDADETGAQDNASTAECFFPWHKDATNAYSISRWRSRWSRGFSISLSRCEFKIGSNDLWSVMTAKWSRPARKRWHFRTAQATAKISNSMVA